MKLKIIDQRLTPAMIAPSTAGSAGLDLRACINEPIQLHGGETRPVRAGIAIALLPDRAALILPRSGTGVRGLLLANGTGLIDSDYRGEITVALWNRNPPCTTPITINPLDRVAQMVVISIARPFYALVDDLDGTSRGLGGFGSTGVA